MSRGHWTSFLPIELHQLLDRLLQKDPAARPGSASEVAQAIDEILPRVIDF